MQSAAYKFKHVSNAPSPTSAACRILYGHPVKFGFPSFPARTPSRILQHCTRAVQQVDKPSVTHKAPTDIISSSIPSSVKEKAKQVDHEVDAILAAWAKQYHMPDLSSFSGNETNGEHYYPPRSDFQGIATACAIIAMWGLLEYHALFQLELTGPWTLTHILHAVATFFSIEFLYTGLFMTTHDAMHGTISFHNRWLNDAIGTVAISLYAWFDYSTLYKKHWQHHNHTGIMHEDPDFHHGNPDVGPWFLKFMQQYISLWQVLRLHCWGQSLIALGAPFPNVLIYLAGAGAMSAFRLFYFGTYLPHRPMEGPQEVMPWTKSRTSPVSRLRSFLTCYHFDFHWEHHRWPYAPWFDLWKCKQISGR